MNKDNASYRKTFKNLGCVTCVDRSCTSQHIRSWCVALETRERIRLSDYLGFKGTDEAFAGALCAILIVGLSDVMRCERM